MKFIAHRGYSKVFPENSLQAFDAVLRHPQNGRSLIGMELDIHPTADWRIVVMHDTAINDENGKKAPVCRLSFDRLQALFSAAHPTARHSISELGDVLKLASHRTELCIEIKEDGYDKKRFCELLAESLGEYGMGNDIVLSSFCPDILRAMMGSLSQSGVKFGYIFSAWEKWTALAEDVRAGLHYIHPQFDLVMKHSSRFASVGLPMQCWVINKLSELQALLRLPVAEKIRAVMTDDITLAELSGKG